MTIDARSHQPVTVAVPFVRHPRGVLLVTLACFVALTLAAAVGGALPADALVREALIAGASAPVVAAMRVVNAAGDYRGLLPGMVILFLVFPRARTRWWLWIVLMIVAAMAPDVVKLVIGRPRPEDASMGFPSGHATAAAAFFGAIVYLASSLPPRPRPVVRVVAVILMVGVGAARIILRAHWPSDVLGGFAFGLALASTAALIDSLETERRSMPDRSD